MAAARAAGLPENTFRSRLLRAAARGLDGNVSGATPLGQIVKGTTTLYGSDGDQMLQWVRRDKEVDPLAVAEAIKDAFTGFKPMVKVVRPPAATEAGKCTLLAAGDLHVGMYAHGDEAGDNWDLKIGERVIGECVADVVSNSPASELGLVSSAATISTPTIAATKPRVPATRLTLTGDIKRSSALEAAWPSTSSTLALRNISAF
jgi:hypothetical protein